MKTRRLGTRTLVVTLLALLLAPAALAGARTASIAAVDTPHARFGVWIDSLQEFLVRNPELTPEQTAAVLDAQRLAEPRLFVDRPGASETKLLAESLAEVRRTLSCTSFADLTSGFGELQPWLASSEVLAAAAANCNCGSSDDCTSGYTCQSVSCTSQAGTTHWGICQKKRTSLEPVEPVDPSSPIAN